MNNLKTGFASKDPKLGLPGPNLSLSLSPIHQLSPQPLLKPTTKLDQPTTQKTTKKKKKRPMK